MAFNNTDKGAIFAPKDEASDLVGVGHITFGTERKNVLVLQGVTKAGKKIYKVFGEIGALFENDDKKNERSPDKSGTLNVNGLDYSAAGWRNTSPKTGNNYTSVTVKIKDTDWQAPKTAPNNDDMEDPASF